MNQIDVFNKVKDVIAKNFDQYLEISGKKVKEFVHNTPTYAGSEKWCEELARTLWDQGLLSPNLDVSDNERQGEVFMEIVFFINRFIQKNLGHSGDSKSRMAAEMKESVLFSEEHVTKDAKDIVDILVAYNKEENL